MLLIITSTGDELLRNVNIDDLERTWSLNLQNKRVLVNFSRFQAAICISKVNCIEMAGNRPRQLAYEIFHIECRL